VGALEAAGKVAEEEEEEEEEEDAGGGAPQGCPKSTNCLSKREHAPSRGAPLEERTATAPIPKTPEDSLRWLNCAMQALEAVLSKEKA